MYTLFNTDPVIRGGGVVYTKANYALDVLKRDTDRWVDYRHLNVASVDSSHFLVKLLQTINIPYTGNIEVYRSQVEQRMGQYSGVMGMTSNLHRGRVHHPGVFYGSQSWEVLIATDEDFSLTNWDWANASPIRVLSHYRSDLGIESLDGDSKTTESGMAVITVNIPMLACQYQLWRASGLSGQEGMERRMSQFLLMYPLTNAVYSHLDVCFFNRICRRQMGVPTGETYRKLPFYTTDLRQRFEQEADKILTNLRVTKQTFVNTLMDIPAFVSDSALQVNRLPKVPFTSQLIWALIAARLNSIAFLLNLGNEMDNDTNTHSINRIRRCLVEVDSNKTLSNGLPSDVSNYLRGYIDQNIRPYL